MAVNLSIKGVPDPLAARLRERAAANHRSLQGELMAILESAAGARTRVTAETVACGPDDWRQRLSLANRKSQAPAESLHQVLERILAQKSRRTGSSVALIRAMRDGRHGVVPANARRTGSPNRGG